MRADKRPQQQACDITIYSDKGSLALRFPKRHNVLWEQLDGKSLKGKPKCLGIGKYGYKDTPEDWKRATQLAIALETDLDHPEWEKLFDPTLAKYGLGGGKYAKLAEVLQMPGVAQTEPESTVGEMWENYLKWKETQVEPTTFYEKFQIAFTNILKGRKWNARKKTYDETDLSIWDAQIDGDCAEKLLRSPACKRNVVDTISALNEAFDRAKQLGKFNLPDANPFFDLHKKVGVNTKEKYNTVVNNDGETLEWWQVQDDKQDELERDRRAFTKEERDIIIEAFYESEKASERNAAPLVEFRFLTGCRPGEAFALRWQDIMFERGIIRFSKSYASRMRITKATKNSTTRMFPMYARLTELLLEIKPVDAVATDLVFRQLKGQSWNNDAHRNVWIESVAEYKGKVYRYPGVVTRLVNEGKISQYLPPYHARHTYITLTAHANKDNTSALLLLAHACENSPEIIMKHYLDVDRSVQLNQV